MANEQDLVLCDRSRPGIVVLTLNRADKRNALCLPLLEQLIDRFRSVEADPDARVLILAAAGPVFCAGLDLKEAQDASLAEKSAHAIADILKTISGSRLVSIAAVQGSAVAGGAGIMSSCDFVVAGNDAQFGYPEVHRGLVPGLVLTFLRRQLRERDVRELVLFGQLVDAHRAMEIGLVNRVVAPNEVFNLSMEIAGRILLGAPHAVAATKSLLADLWPRTVNDDLNAAHAHHMEARNSGEAAEGMRAFYEKRQPRWQSV